MMDRWVIITVCIAVAVIIIAMADCTKHSIERGYDPLASKVIQPNK